MYQIYHTWIHPLSSLSQIIVINQSIISGVCLSALSFFESLWEASLALEDDLWAPRSTVSHWLEPLILKPIISSQAAVQSNGYAAKLSTDGTAGLMVKWNVSMPGVSPVPAPEMHPPIWLLQNAFLDTRLRVLQVIGDIQSVTCSS
jgi:hypothetical protein